MYRLLRLNYNKRFTAVGWFFVQYCLVYAFISFFTSPSCSHAFSKSLKLCDPFLLVLVSFLPRIRALSLEFAFSQAEGNCSVVFILRVLVLSQQSSSISVNVVGAPWVFISGKELECSNDSEIHNALYSSMPVFFLQRFSHSWLLSPSLGRRG